MILIGHSNKGAALLLTFVIMATLAAISVAFLYMVSVKTKIPGFDVSDAKALYLAEAGIQKAVWNLKTPIKDKGRGEDWTSSGTTESLADGTYTIAVERWDFALADNGSTASESPSSGSSLSGPKNAIDDDDSTYWQSRDYPTAINPQELIVEFPRPLSINKVRFLSTSVKSRPRNYTWQVSKDGVSYSTVVSKVNNKSADVTDEFTAVSDVLFLKLSVTAAGETSFSILPVKGKKAKVSKKRGGFIAKTKVSVATLETIGSKISSTGVVGDMQRKIEQTIIADDATQTAFDEIDWIEVEPDS